MREHLHLTRVPEGAERDYIRGALAYFWLVLSICFVSVKNKIKKTNGFMNTRVCDVMLTEIQSGPKSSNALAKAVFADGTVSKNAFQAFYYSIHPYQYGLLVAIYDVDRQWIYTNMLPRYEYGTKPYRLSVEEQLH